MEAEFRASLESNTLPTLGDGAVAMPTLGKWGQVLTTNLLPRYGEAMLRGTIFTGCTASSGVAHGTTIGTTAPFTLANPLGSGKTLIVLRCSVAYISGTLGTGTTYYVANTNPSASAVTGTAITVTKTYLSNANATAQGNVGLAFTTATVPATPTLLRPAISLTPILATSVVAPYLLLNDDLNGEFGIAPGCALSLESVAAGGTSPLLTIGMTWMELAL